MYGQSAEVEGIVRRIGTHVVLPTLFEPPAFAIEANSRELARIYANPIGGGPTPFPTGYGPTLTGPGAYVSEVPGEMPETIVICAHYDSAWRAGGAVDNASGVEGVRRIVERVVSRPHRRTLLAIAFGAEELGLSGARFFVQDAKTRGELGRIKGVVNLECIARGERLELWAAPEDLKERGLRIATELRLGDLPTRLAIAGSDHFPFASEGIPAACIIRWPYVEYHLPADDPGIADEALLAPAVELASRLVEELLG
jgi:Peptidase family M28